MAMSTVSVVDFSAQFGGQDAADAILPHFRTLKCVSRELHLDGFPLHELAFILRVDGEVQKYPPMLDGNIKVNKKSGYVSIDIEISIEDRERIVDAISEAIISSIEKLQEHKKTMSMGINFDLLRKSLLLLIERYKTSCNA